MVTPRLLPPRATEGISVSSRPPAATPRPYGPLASAGESGRQGGSCLTPPPPPFLAIRTRYFAWESSVGRARWSFKAVFYYNSSGLGEQISSQIKIFTNS